MWLMAAWSNKGYKPQETCECASFAYCSAHSTQWPGSDGLGQRLLELRRFEDRLYGWGGERSQRADAECLEALEASFKPESLAQFARGLGQGLAQVRESLARSLAQAGKSLPQKLMSQYCCMENGEVARALAGYAALGLPLSAVKKAAQRLEDRAVEKQAMALAEAASLGRALEANPGSAAGGKMAL